ncbi:sulfite exporter TauE/SafE family protein [Morganella psychrotolerans]|uniref:Probable membrane transporter protein n=1 Tax=Morganella psychrotolerans TaxID=368603 RepID=A0A1B8H6S4_9GAMM|nr:sulfite exporter TauE/SafE family protein [Morganella psychrotolerans]OBU04767.1 hypothetical protein AYY17_07645 [Morganella psychrotolerans]
MSYLLLSLTSIIAGLISGVTGTGSSLILIPVLTATLGAKEAVPVMAIAALLGNISRVVIWRKEIDWSAFCWFALPALPAVVAGANTLIALPESILNTTLGIFFLALCPARHWLKYSNFTLRPVHLLFCGIFTGFLTGLVFSTGPLMLPLLSAYGLLPAPLLATESAISFLLYLTKSVTFTRLGILTPDIMISGLLTGMMIALGSLGAKRIVLALPPAFYSWILDTVLIVAGVGLIFAG